ncbi:hypothetical protein PAPYR_3594 [Paratrimastix pyriformis]|uniref:Uncharacterized protein n=1 Tax=Paratrimastix pyriformis TaxID=342808 RepID=A0ABQ8URQ3_9EUKA|nr:hypothetical protein PAPYR_3594 [Paratrimastix pyriformis]
MRILFISSLLFAFALGSCEPTAARCVPCCTPPSPVTQIDPANLDFDAPKQKKNSTEENQSDAEEEDNTALFGSLGSFGWGGSSFGNLFSGFTGGPSMRTGEFPARGYPITGCSFLIAPQTGGGGYSTYGLGGSARLGRGRGQSLSKAWASNKAANAARRRC